MAIARFIKSCGIRWESGDSLDRSVIIEGVRFAYWMDLVQSFHSRQWSCDGLCQLRIQPQVFTPNLEQCINRSMECPRMLGWKCKTHRPFVDSRNSLWPSLKGLIKSTTREKNYLNYAFDILCDIHIFSHGYNSFW